MFSLTGFLTISEIVKLIELFLALTATSDVLKIGFSILDRIREYNGSTIVQDLMPSMF